MRARIHERQSFNDFKSVNSLYLSQIEYYVQVKSCHYTKNNGDKSWKNLKDKRKN